MAAFLSALPFNLSGKNLSSTTPPRNMQEDEKDELSRGKDVTCAICKNFFESIHQLSNTDQVLDNQLYSKICEQCFVKENEIRDGSHAGWRNHWLCEEIYRKALPYMAIGAGFTTIAYASIKICF